MNQNESRKAVKELIQTRWPKWEPTGQQLADVIEIIKPFTYEAVNQAAMSLRKENNFDNPETGKLEKLCRQSRQQKEITQWVFVYVIFPEVKKKHEFWIPCKTTIDFTNQQESDLFMRYVHNLVYNYQETYNIIDEPEIYLGEENMRAAQKRFYNEIMGIKAKGTWKTTLAELNNKFAVPF